MRPDRQPGESAMQNEPIRIEEGSGNEFAGLDLPNPEERLTKPAGRRAFPWRRGSGGRWNGSGRDWGIICSRTCGP